MSNRRTGNPNPAHLNRAKTHCPRGHEYNEENTDPWYLKWYKRRVCKICNTARKRRYSELKRAQKRAEKV